MVPRRMEMPEKVEAGREKWPELGRYVLQVDRLVKSSHPTAKSAKSAGLAIKKEFPHRHVAVYDSLDRIYMALPRPALSE